MSPVREGRSLLLVHAHPDDESIFTGATIAKYAAESARVTLVTCTMGELGPNPLAAGTADREQQLGEHRTRELGTACAALGVTDRRFLGGPGRWRDSGAMGAAGNHDPRCFWRADVDEAANELVTVICEVAPQAIVTYDADGFYGHPDHIQAHRVAWRAFQLACDPMRTKFYVTTIPRTVLAETIRRQVRPAGRTGTRPPEDLGLGVPDEQVTTEIDATAYLDAKLAALRAHATQVRVDGPFFTVSGLIELRALGVEYYLLLAGPRRADSGPLRPGREDDLFAGV